MTRQLVITVKPHFTDTLLSQIACFVAAEEKIRLIRTLSMSHSVSVRINGV